MDKNDRWEGFLWGQVLLIGLLGATLALFLTYPSLRHPYSLPELKLVLATLYMIAAGLVAVLTCTRFSVEGRRYDLFLGGHFARGHVRVERNVRRRRNHTWRLHTCQRG